jgi:hypothetical protein
MPFWKRENPSLRTNNQFGTVMGAMTMTSSQACHKISILGLTYQRILVLDQHV